MAPMAKVAALGAAVALAATFAPDAWGHATLLSSSPANGAVVATAPREARFVFDEGVRVASGIRAVRNGGASVLGGSARIVGGKTLVVPLQHLSTGDYTVLWRVVSDDGHTEAGVIAFAVGAGLPPPRASLTAGSGPTAGNVLSRWLVLVGLLVVAGGAIFRLVLGRASVAPALVGFVAVFLGAAGLVPHHGSFATRFGIAYALLALLAAVGALFAAVSLVDRRFEVPAWVVGLVALPAPSFAGHALDPGRPRIEVAADVLHLAAAAVWTGGLVQLVLALRADGGRPGLARRFSSLAVASVLVLAVTGVGRALGELSAVSQVWTTGYGRLLIAKTSLLAVLVGLGWLNRYRLVPGGRVSTLRRSATVELVLLAGLLGVVAVLTDARPGRARVARVASPALAPPPLPPRDAVVLAREDGNDGVTLATEPGRMQVTVFGQQGLGVDGLDVTVAGVSTSSCGPGCYEAGTSTRGNVRVSVGSRSMVFHVPGSAPDALRLVRAATRAFRRLRSVTYVERLASGPNDRIVTRFVLEAPNRVEYRIVHGPAAIVIGERRWDRTGTRWVESASSILSQPSPAWGTTITNAHVLARSRRSVVVSFLNPAVPAWFTVRFDRRLLPRTADMTATAHFMHHVYSGFDAPRQIFPPGG
jgi:copper transport protein